MGFSNELSCEARSFSCHHHNPEFFKARGFEALVSCTGILCCTVYLAPQLFLLAYLHTNVGPPRSASSLSAFQSSNCHLAMGLLHPLCPSPPFLPIWMNVSSLTPWLSDFHTVQFSDVSGRFLFLNFLLSFFWLCEEAKCYLPTPPYWLEALFGSHLISLSNIIRFSV